MKLLFCLIFFLFCFPLIFGGEIENKYQRKSSITGEITFLEEILEDFSSSFHLIQKYSINNQILNQNSSCKRPKYLNLIELIDYGTKPIEWFEPSFIRTKGHQNVTDHARFGFLDAYGGRLKNGTIEILLPEEKNNQLILRNNQKVSSFLLYCEGSAYGFGYNDSAGLAPPIQISLFSMNQFKNLFIDSTTTPISTTPTNSMREENECYCDILLPGKLYSLLGFVYYPQYGHTIFNTFANYYQLLKLNHFYPNNKEIEEEGREESNEDDQINILTSLLRTPTSEAKDVPYTYYEIQWHEMYNELFLKLATNIYSWEYLHKLSLTNPTQRICFERLTIGLPPYLDPLNKTVTIELWTDFMKSMISFYFEKEIQLLLNLREFNSKKDILTNSQLNQFNPITNNNENENENNQNKNICLVTFIVRFVESIPTQSSSSSSSTSSQPPPTSRDLINLHELQLIAEENGCQVKYLLLQHLTIKEQILQLRWNTTLLILSDGTAIYNNIFLTSCHTVLRYDTWNKPGIVPNFGICKYIRYLPFLNETIWLEIETNEIGKRFNQLNQSNSTEFNQMLLGKLEFPNHDIEYYLREYQLTYINPKQFEKVLQESIEWYKICKQEIQEGKREL